MFFHYILFLVIFLISSCGFWPHKESPSKESYQKILLNIYRALYAYKIEKGHFPTTEGRFIRLQEVSSLQPYLADRIDGPIEKLSSFVAVQSDHFVVILVKKRLGNIFYTEKINSNKKLYNSEEVTAHNGHLETTELL